MTSWLKDECLGSIFFYFSQFSGFDWNLLCARLIVYITPAPHKCPGWGIGYNFPILQKAKVEIGRWPTTSPASWLQDPRWKASLIWPVIFPWHHPCLPWHHSGQSLASVEHPGSGNEREFVVLSTSKRNKWPSRATDSSTVIWDEALPLMDLILIPVWTLPHALSTPPVVSVKLE